MSEEREGREKAVWVPVEFTNEEFEKIERLKEAFGGLPLNAPFGSGGPEVERLEGKVRLHVPFSLDEYMNLEDRLRELNAGGRRLEPGDLVHHLTMGMLDRYTTEELLEKEMRKIETENQEMKRIRDLLG